MFADFTIDILCVTDFGPRVQTGGYSFGQIRDLPADFGPPISEDGVAGLLVVSTASSCSASHH
jgi:hypothetical protein